MVKDKYLMGSLNTQKLNEIAKKYNLGNYVAGQSFDSVKDKMTEEDYETSQKLLDYYTRQKTETDNYNYNEGLIDQSKKQALQENAISKELSMKYLPEYLKLQGMGGLGVSESSITEASNNFQNARNTINTSANLQKNELLRNYQENMGNLDVGANQETQSIAEKYKAKAEQEKLEAEAKSANNLMFAQEILNTKATGMMDENGKISQKAKSDLNTYIETNYKHKLTDSDYEQLKAYIEQFAATTTEEEAEIDNQSYVMNNLGVTDEGLVKAIANSEAGITSFGDFAGTGSNGNQDEWVKNVLADAKKGDDDATKIIKDGDVVDFNRGGGTDRYVYYKGYWYPTNNKITIKRGSDNKVKRK